MSSSYFEHQGGWALIGFFSLGVVAIPGVEAPGSKGEFSLATGQVCPYELGAFKCVEVIAVEVIAIEVIESQTWSDSTAIIATVSLLGRSIRKYTNTTKAYLTHDATSVRKNHLTGKNHVKLVCDYYEGKRCAYHC
jgi:hypothetical protein